MKQQSKLCAHCGGEFVPERRNGMYCSPTCRQYSYIKRKTGEAPDDRVKQKKEIDRQLESVPPLVIEDTGEELSAQLPLNNEKQSIEIEGNNYSSSKEHLTETKELMLADKNEINNPSKEDFTMNNNQLSPSSEVLWKQAVDSLSKKSYADLFELEKDSLNELLMDWWYRNIKNNKERIKLVRENEKSKDFIERLLKFDGTEVKRVYVKQYLLQIQEYESKFPEQVSDFISGHCIVGDMRIMALEFLEKMKALNVSSLLFKLTDRQRAEFQVMLKFMNEFNMQSPDYWLIE